jgi:Arc/MetJ-type ribon-helix-helix transcriptional regulator
MGAALASGDPDAASDTIGAGSPEGDDRMGVSGPKEERRHPSLSRELDRAMERLVRATGRLDVSDALREAMASALEALAPLREQARHARGPARDTITARLVELDGALAAAARSACGPGVEAVHEEAAAELAAYRGRLTPEVWQKSLEASVDRLLRERYGLPTLDPDRV